MTDLSQTNLAFPKIKLKSGKIRSFWQNLVRHQASVNLWWSAGTSTSRASTGSSPTSSTLPGRMSIARWGCQLPGRRWLPVSTYPYFHLLVFVFVSCFMTNIKVAIMKNTSREDVNCKVVHCMSHHVKTWAWGEISPSRIKSNSQWIIISERLSFFSVLIRWFSWTNQSRTWNLRVGAKIFEIWG